MLLTKRGSKAGWVAGSLALSAAITAAAAGEDERPVTAQPDLGARLQEMEQEMNRLRQDNLEMKDEIDELRAQTGDGWLTEKRADEIRALVQDTLADADTRASLLDSGMTAGWADHFFLASPDGRFKLVLEGQSQVRYVYNYKERTPFSADQDQHRQGFENARTRLTFRGHVFSPDWEYLIRTELLRTNGFDNLLDAWIRHYFNDELSVRVGQFKLPFNREELVSSAYQLAVERSLVNEAVNIGRAQGIELAYTNDANRLVFAFTDGASPSGVLSSAQLLGTTQGASRTALTFDTEYALTARYELLAAGTWKQFEDFTSPGTDEFGLLWGLAVHAQESESTGLPSLLQSTNRGVAGTTDLSIEWGGANMFASATYHYVDSAASFLGNFHMIGIVLQGGIYVTPKWEVFIRGEYGQMDTQSGGIYSTPDLNMVTVGANYYIDGQDIKWSTDIGFGIYEIGNGGFAAPLTGFVSDLAGYRVDGDGGEPQVVFRTQLQLLF